MGTKEFTLLKASAFEAKVDEYLIFLGRPCFMMIRKFIDPDHYGTDPGAVGDGHE